jgi:rhomboid family GlyGly-CTERM serine protease
MSPRTRAATRGHGAGLLPGAALALALAAPVLVFLVPSLAAQLVCERAAVTAGEPWRWLTGHWVHVSWDHLLWDTGAFVVLGALCACASRARFLAGVWLSALAIPPLLWIARPGLDTYCGLSGIDSALFGLLVASLLRRTIAARAIPAAVLTALLAAAFAAKVGYEACTSATLFVDSAASDAVPEPLAHAVGFAAGVAVALAGPARRPARITASADAAARLRVS